MIRKAVGAIIRLNNQFLLVHKIKIMNGKNEPQDIEGEWDFPKGGVKPHEMDLEKAILRELREETGSDKYRIVKKFEDKISFQFPLSFQKESEFKSQETTIFLVDYIGDKTEIRSQDEEIDRIGFFSRDEVIEKLAHNESKEFFMKVFPE